MNSIQIFENPEFGIVRTTKHNGEIAFVAKDVAERLGYIWKGTSGTISHVPEEWRGVCSVQTPSGNQDMTVLTEQGLYFFLARSDKPKALPFQKWIAGEVVPAIRKTGTYAVKRSTQELALEAILALQADIEVLQAKIAADAGKVNFADQILCSRHGIEIGSFAKILHDNGMDIGRTRLFQKLREDKYLTSNNEPYQKWKDSGFFEVIESCYGAPGGEQRPYIKTLVTPAGQKHLLEKYQNCTEKKEKKKVQGKTPERITHDLPPDTEFLSTLQPFCDF